MKTYILKWNPAISSVTMERYENELIDKEWPEYNWSFWDYKDAQAGDKFYMLRVGEGNTGVVMSGTLISEAYQSKDWSGKGRTVFYCDIAPDFILHPDKCPIISTEQLQQAMPDFQWDGGHSGLILPDELCPILDKMWSEHINRLQDEDMFDFVRASDPMLSDEFNDD
ncbi:MAG: hypothetical protein J5980_00485 [Muribaculaceae bacterium]|nr:hypothetical protein [Muribaculaceae bacterium]